MTDRLSTTLLLVRHGQSIWNAERRWQGQADPPLSDHGRHQALAASARVGDVDVIVSSPQQRALETATIISEQLGVGPVVVVEDLRERSAGVWSGLTRTEIDDQYPGWLDSERWPEGWEPDDQLFERVDKALRSIVAAYGGGTLFVVCHGGVIRTVETNLGIDHGRVPNLSGRLVTLDGENPVDNNGQRSNVQWRIGEQVQLIESDLATGGDGQRV